MIHTRKRVHPVGVLALAVVVSCVCAGCQTSEEPLAVYAGGGNSLTTMIVEGGVLSPRVTWVGGYVSAFGVNRGRIARLDSTLIWLVHQGGDNLHFPQTYGQLPAGAEDLTSRYGGHSLGKLAEDEVYTFWIIRDDAWAVIAAQPGKVLAIDSTSTAVTRLSGDTLYVSARSLALSVTPVDLYISIKNVSSFGKLALINVTATDTSNAPVITFKIIQAGVPDSLLADIGISAGGGYDVTKVVWEVLAVDTSGGQTRYWTKDVIGSPVVVGRDIPGTQTFAAFPAAGLARNQTYYVWIANKNWDQKNRSRTASNYAYATFEVY